MFFEPEGVGSRSADGASKRGPTPSRNLLVLPTQPRGRHPTLSPAMFFEPEGRGSRRADGAQSAIGRRPPKRLEDDPWRTGMAVGR